MLYFTSDTHFNHARIIELSQRPFHDVADMNHRLIEGWNSRVSNGDTIYVLGDFWFPGRDPWEIFNQLNGHKHLVVGNHDEQNKQVLRLPWRTINQLLTLKWKGVRFELCHYPIESWKHSYRNAVMLHGHCHGNLRQVLPHRFDVGVDVHNYKPVSAYEIVGRAMFQTWTPADHQRGS